MGHKDTNMNALEKMKSTMTEEEAVALQGAAKGEFLQGVRARPHDGAGDHNQRRHGRAVPIVILSQDKCCLEKPGNEGKRRKMKGGRPLQPLS